MNSWHAVGTAGGPWVIPKVPPTASFIYLRGRNSIVKRVVQVG
jgi:hypothetical protein